MNNTFTGFSEAAVYLQSGVTTTVTGNTFTGNAVGVYIIYNGHTATTVTGNTYTFPGSTDADVKVSGGVYKNVAWNESAGTVYRVISSTSVFGIEEGGRLTITNGIVVKVDADKVIWVQSTGVLVATGVKFTATDPANQWKGISFGSPDQSESRLEGCIIEYAKGTNNSAMVDAYWGSIATGSPTIIGCTIGNGTAPRGIYVLNASPSILNNTFTGFSEAAVYLQSGITTTVTGNTFTGNAVGVYIIYNGHTATTVTGNTYTFPGSTDADVKVSGGVYKNVAWMKRRNRLPSYFKHCVFGIGRADGSPLPTALW